MLCLLKGEKNLIKRTASELGQGRTDTNPPIRSRNLIRSTRRRKKKDDSGRRTGIEKMKGTYKATIHSVDYVIASLCSNAMDPLSTEVYCIDRDGQEVRLRFTWAMDQLRQRERGLFCLFPPHLSHEWTHTHTLSIFQFGQERKVSTVELSPFHPFHLAFSRLSKRISPSSLA